MFKKIVNNKSDLQSAVSQFIREHCQVNAPYNLDDSYTLIIATSKKQKSIEQNSLFHGLLQAFWESGCSSFESYDDLRLHYKETAGLIERVSIPSFSNEEKGIIYKIFKMLPISEATKTNIFYALRLEKFIKSEAEIIAYAINNLPFRKNVKNALKNIINSRIEIHHSWSEVSKSKAQFTITELINNCIESGAYASSNKVKEIIDELNELTKFIG